MAEAKKIHLELDIPAAQAELFRVLVHNLNYQDYEDPTKYTGPYGVEILAEEPCLSNGEPEVEFSLWFDRPATAYWFALRLHEARAVWQGLTPPVKWSAAVFRGKSSYLGPQQGQTYHIRLVTPGVLYPYQILIQELPGCTDEYLTVAAARQPWQLVEQEGAPASG